MISTSLAVLALSGLIQANLTVQPAWQTDYTAAVKLSAKEHKPLAVFITKGAAKNLDQLPDAAAKVLKTNYIAVAINSDDATGKKLAEAFEMTEGVVISDATGGKQALRIEGQTNPSDLPETLERLAQPNHVTTTTEVYGAAPAAVVAPPVTSYYTPAPYCRSCQQQQYRR